jgi:hypothetical protein
VSNVVSTLIFLVFLTPNVSSVNVGNFCTWYSSSLYFLLFRAMVFDEDVSF